MFSVVISSLLLTPGLTAPLTQANSGFISENKLYRKFEYMIPMRDGVKLFTAVYVPKKSGLHPILLERTPYSAGPYGKAISAPEGGPYFDAGYIYAEQDVRGKFMSGGDFVDVRPELPSHHGPKDTDESTDAYDTIDYLIKHVPDNNKRVGLTGISYPGFYAEMGAINSHPALKAVSPQAPVSEWFLGDDWHHNGVLFQQDAFDFMSWFGTVRTGPYKEQAGLGDIDRGNKSAYDFYLQTGALPNFDKLYYKGRIPFWNEVLAHDTYDSWWKARSAPSKLVNCHCAMLFVGGLFDAEDMYGAFHSYAAAKAQNPNTTVDLAMGPWFHGMWAGGDGDSFGNLKFGMPTSDWFQSNVEFPFFQKYLQDSPKVKGPSPVTIFETGANAWHHLSSWPPKNLQRETFYLDGNHKVVESKPTSDGADDYVNDPAHPTPYTEDLTLKNRPATYMLADQRFAQARPDVETYETAPFEKDTHLAGPVDVKLWIKTTGSDADFVVKVIDVYPDDATDETRSGQSMKGYEIMIRGDVMRAKFRRSFSSPSLLIPGKATLVPFEMNSIFHDFRKGHRLMIQIQSNWFPLTDRNPNRFEDINTAKDSDFQKATISILHGPDYPSEIEIGKED